MKNSSSCQFWLEWRKSFREKFLTKLLQLVRHGEPVNGALPSTEVDQRALRTVRGRHLQVRLDLENDFKIMFPSEELYPLVRIWDRR